MANPSGHLTLAVSNGLASFLPTRVQGVSGVAGLEASRWPGRLRLFRNLGGRHDGACLLPFLLEVSGAHGAGRVFFGGRQPANI
jgi:hypothetical protein